MSDEQRVIPAVVYFTSQQDQKVDRNGLSGLDKKFEKGSLNYGYYDHAKVCECVFMDELFYSIKTGIQTKFGVKLFGVGIPVIKKEDLPEPFLQFNYQDIKDFRVFLKGGWPRLAIKLPYGYVILTAVTSQTFQDGDKHFDLVADVHKFYKDTLGIKAGRTMLFKDYCPSFAEWLSERFQSLQDQGKFRRELDFKVPACPTHKKIGQYSPENQKYYCHKCQVYYQ
jgi:hypothetical protein